MIVIKVQGVKPIKYHWFKDGKRLEDGIDFKGATTNVLCIIKFIMKSKGKYKCEVEDKYGDHRIFSDEITFGKLFKCMCYLLH